MKILLRSVSLTMLALATAACSTTAPTAMKSDEVPKAFTAPATPGVSQEVTTDWWKSFSSPELTSLVETARTDNLDLAVAAARVQQAQAQTGLATSALFPNVNLSGSAKRQGTNHTGTTFNTFGASLGASYELDFWGLAQDNLRAARNSARAAIYAKDVVMLTVSANVANTYFDVVALRERLDIAKKNVDAAKRILAITQAKVDNGVSSNLDLAQQKALLAGQEAQIPALEEQEREARYALATLLGRPPEGFDIKDASLEGVVAPPVTPGLPSSLLQRRPDVAEAEASLVAAHANVDAARAAFLPAIGLTGSGGYASSAISSLINPSNLAWSVGASLLQTVFDGGRLTSQSDIAKAQEAELIASYRSTVLAALVDVETALGSTSSLAEQERLTNEQVTNAAEAFRISELQYREGVVDLLTVLTAQQTLFSSQDKLVQIKLARLQAGVGLYRALGGGWTVDADKDIPTRNDFVPVPDLTDLPVGNPL
ncbi:MAG: efflux transporter outer membrane subunit [Alphaproteobacteria bacterium]|nr:efflux transporter outer membrane subunit [Alphaproteobacteria bacterium]